MATRSITIMESAYEVLKARKRSGESFSDVVERIAGRRSLTDLAGVVSDEDAERIADEVESVRSEVDEEFEERSEKVEGVFE